MNKLSAIREKQAFRLAAAAVLVAVAAAFYVVIHVRRPDNVHLWMYGSLVPCLLFELLFFRRDAIRVCSLLALSFTMAADVFLVLYDDYYEWAVACFLVCQLLYAGRLLLAGSIRQGRIGMALRLCLVVAGEAAAVGILRGDFDFLAALAVFYIANLLANVVTAFLMIRHSPLFAAGLLLFLLCDICVGLNFLPNYLQIDGGLVGRMIDSPVNWSWIFYLPSQVLIALGTVFARSLRRREPLLR